MSCEWEKYPMGTVDVTPGWTVQLLCPIANVIAEHQICRPNTWYIAGMAGISAQSSLSDSVEEDLLATISSSTSLTADSNYQQSTAEITAWANVTSNVNEMSVGSLSGSADFPDVAPS